MQQCVYSITSSATGKSDIAGAYGRSHLICEFRACTRISEISFSEAHWHRFG